MIQRIQSLWLLLAAACAFAGFKFPFFSGTKLNEAALQKLTASGNFLILLLTVSVGALALFAIFLFKNRTLQLRLCVLGILLEAVLLFLYYRATQNYLEGTYALTAILQPVIVLSFVLAARAINKDSKIVKDSDRLR